MGFLVNEFLSAFSGRRLRLAFGKLELRVLETLWRRGEPTSVRAILDDFPEAAYTTLMTTLDRLFRKGVLDRERAGRAFLYRPRYARPELEALVTADALNAFLGHEPESLKPALSFLVDAFGARDEKLLDELEELLRRKRAGSEDAER